jgi:hypothetical protein
MELAVALLYLATTMLKLTLAVQPKTSNGAAGAVPQAVEWWEHFVPGSSTQMQGGSAVPRWLAALFPRGV